MTIAAFYEHLTGQVDHQPWRERANCRGLDPALFVMARGDSGREAKAVCRACEVRAECLSYALDSGEKFGVWGGTSERERRRLRHEPMDERRVEVRITETRCVACGRVEGSHNGCIAELRTQRNRRRRVG